MAINQLGRRILKTRTRPCIVYIASKISTYNITPNQISILSVVFAILASVCLLQLTSVWKWILAIIFIQFRLFCNLMDGLIAIEGGKSSKLGEIYNDLPDRISDVLIIIAFGYSVPGYTMNLFGNIELTTFFMAQFAAILAVFTAYVRTLFSSLGAPANYCGPMAKQHRMALFTLACLVQFLLQEAQVVTITLLVLNLGLLITIYRRVASGVQYIICH